MEEINNIEKEISSTFDSVELINKLNLIENKSQEDIDCISRNVEHLKIKMNQTSFVELLNNYQIEIINSLIV
jgi:hypothetical protein